MIIEKIDVKSEYFYQEARYTICTFEDESSALFAAKKYYEYASNLNNKDANIQLAKIKGKQINAIHTQQYYDELCHNLPLKIPIVVNESKTSSHSNK